MTNFMEVSIRIPRGLYEDIEKRARSMGINVQTCIRTLLERHINKVKIKSKYGGLGIDEVDLVVRLRSVVKNIKTATEKGSQDIELSKVCIEDLARIVRDIVGQVEERVARECNSRLANECDDYTRLKELKNKLSRVKDVVEQMKMAILEYENEAVQYIKRLFYMERCSLAELAIVFPYTIDKSMAKLLMALLEIEFHI